MNELVHQLDKLIKDYERGSGMDSKVDHSIMVGIDGAVILFRAHDWLLSDRFSFTSDTDELMRFDGIPIRIRERVTGQVVITPDHYLPKPSCCDGIALSTLMICHARSES